jgi:arylsulfatase A-like enzyme
MSVYPTLIEMCGLKPRQGIEGVSVMPLLRNPHARWDRPALTTYMRGNHSVRDERWRYIRYSDGAEELYDHTNDQLEWNNLANNAALEEIKSNLARRLPKSNAPDSAIER